MGSTLEQPFGGSTDDFYEGDTHVKYKLRHFGKFKILAVVAGVLAVLTIVFIVLFAVSMSRTKEKGTTSGRLICDTKNCLFTAYDMLQQLNQSVDPCEDFYQYACGGWIKSNPLRKGETSRTGFSTVSEKNYAVLKKAVESSWKTYSKNEAVMKTARFYNSCIDADAVEATGDAPLKTLIRELGGWHVNGNVSDEDILLRIAKINQVVPKKPLFNVKVRVNPQRSDTHVVMFEKASVGMSKDYYVKDTANNLKVREAYQQYMKRVAYLISDDKNSTRTDALMMEVYKFEAALSKLEQLNYGSYSAEELMQQAAASGNLENDITISIKQLANASGIKVAEIVGFLTQVFSSQKFTFDEKSRILVYPPKYLLYLYQLYVNQTIKDPKVIDNYAMWTVIHQFILALPSNYSEANNLFRSSLVGNATDHRWKKCLSNMQYAMKMPLGLLFVERAFDKESRATIKEMSNYVRESFLKNLAECTWMDGNTKENARQKALAIKEDIGYPDFIKDPVKLTNEIKDLEVGSQLFQNVRNTMKFMVQTNFAKLTKPVDKDEWLLGPSQTNGYYAPNQNRIVFLAGILQPPFYNPLYPKYLNYGGIGMVIGHEITHGFDGTGRLFDKDGNYKTWWSDESNQNFLQRASCLVKQYDKFSLFGVKLNGSNTLNENIADNGGIKIAYSGYKSWVKAHGMEGVLPGLGLTADQLFFVGFARPWCSIYTKKPALTQIEQDSHSNSKFRVIGTLQNYPKFAEAFKCKPNSYMNPEQKCSVW
ncbi:neprilysin-like [Actinia tenebrosa]|uniref:Neprilysin-like n=1 Tax=Actinia tenebrosa TaxID=6105 RepID=A0A6P8HBR9_ACTTE|nr:neprilysin-like [Actinia tenebrosa]